MIRALVLAVFAALAPASGSAQRLEPGLAIAWESSGRVAESRSTSTVTAVEPDGGFRFRYELDRGGGRLGVLDQRVAGPDRERAAVLKAYYTSRDGVTMPGATALVVSRALFGELKAGRVARFTLLDGERVEGRYVPARRLAATLRREPATAGFVTILNGRTVTLSAINASGTAGSEPFRLTLLDDPDLPLVLASEVGGWGGRVTRIVEGAAR